MHTFNQHFHRAIGQLEHLENRGYRPDLIQVGSIRLVLVGGFLCYQQDLLAFLGSQFQCLDGFGPANEKRYDQMRVNHHIAQRQ